MQDWSFEAWKIIEVRKSSVVLRVAKILLLAEQVIVNCWRAMVLFGLVGHLGVRNHMVAARWRLFAGFPASQRGEVFEDCLQCLAWNRVGWLKLLLDDEIALSDPS